MNDDTCIQILVGHTNAIQCLISLSDETIKVWNLDDDICFQTFNGQMGEVYSLLLLKDGNLASGSQDKTVKI